MNNGDKQTTRIFAWIAEDRTGVEGIIAYPTEFGFLPLVATDEKLARGMSQQAYQAAHARGTDPKLIAFDRVEQLWPR